MLVVKNSAASTGNRRDLGSVPGSGKSPGRPGYPLQYSCLENPMDRGAWRATARWVTKDTTEATEHCTPLPSLHFCAALTCHCLLPHPGMPWKQEHVPFRIYLFLFGCTGSPLLRVDFLQVWGAQATLVVTCWLLLSQSRGSRCTGLSSYCTRAQ